jgi:iron complex outermembrane receptor protein
MRDFIGLNSDAITGSAFHNIGKMSTAGGEMELHGHWPNGISGTASYSNTFLQLGVNPEPLINSPKHIGKVDMSLPLLRDRLFASIDSQYTGRRTTLTQAEVGPYTVVNLTLLGRQVTHHLDLSASLYNALDKRFYDPGAQQHLQDALQQDGRNFRAKLVWTFGAK